MRYDEIKPGMIIVGLGFILTINNQTDISLKTKTTYIDYNDVAYKCTVELHSDQDYELFAEKGSAEYDVCVSDLIKELMDHQAEVGDMLSSLMLKSTNAFQVLDGE